MDQRGVKEVSSIVREILANDKTAKGKVKLEQVIEIYEATLLSALDGETEIGQRYRAEQCRKKHKD